MQSLTIASALQKHKIDGTSPWFILLDIFPTKDNPAIVLRVARNTDDVVWRGNTYVAFGFEIDNIEESATGQLPNVTVRVSNVSRAVQGQLEPYSGGIGASVVLTVVNAADMLGDPVQQYTWTIIQASSNEQWVTFVLGAPDPLRKQFPAGIYIKGHCMHVFNNPTLQAACDPAGAQCGFVGVVTTCDKTLDGANGCRSKGNQGRFGGFPGIDTQGFRAASVV